MGTGHPEASGPCPTVHLLPGIAPCPKRSCQACQEPGKAVCLLHALGHLPRAGWEGSTCHQDDVLRVTVPLLSPTLRTQRSPKPRGSEGLPAPHREGPSSERLLLGHLLLQPGKSHCQEGKRGGKARTTPSQSGFSSSRSRARRRDGKVRLTSRHGSELKGKRQ